jgi:hypothetical protein
MILYAIIGVAVICFYNFSPNMQKQGACLVGEKWQPRVWRSNARRRRRRKGHSRRAAHTNE